MNAIIILLIIGLLVFISILIILHFNNKEKTSEVKEYSGPVRPRDDEAYFRKTGITRPIN